MNGNLSVGERSSRGRGFVTTSGLGSQTAAALRTPIPRSYIGPCVYTDTCPTAENTARPSHRPSVVSRASGGQMGGGVACPQGRRTERRHRRVPQTPPAPLPPQPQVNTHYVPHTMTPGEVRYLYGSRSGVPLSSAVR
ncbi:unnamed protein product [Pleuronectes platessa]|uniref:Uncharacterized protein n=1 Tax=Pleuronectes platessa TaxID=8262 RepID=A0A9N7UJA4_PLEPL|nr:unnamed protein product [Pleuronectes platessa]